jgi:thiosulfate dehydrogenase (quinone) large subunit
VSVPWADRSRQVGWVLLPLRAFLGFVFAYGGISKIADRHFLDGASPTSMRASVEAARPGSPIGTLLGPVASHATVFGVLMATAEIAVATGLLLGLFTRIAAFGGMLLAASLWLTVSWGASPWFTSADLVYLFALTPFLIAGAGGVYSADAWLDAARARHPGQAEDRTRRALVVGGAALGGMTLLGLSTLFRSSGSAGRRRADPVLPPRTLLPASDVPVGGAREVTDPGTGDPTWVLQLTPGRFTALDAICPHQGCQVDFVSAVDGFACPCHGSLFDPQGNRISGPAPRGLTKLAVDVTGGNVRAT